MLADELLEDFLFPPVAFVWLSLMEFFPAFYFSVFFQLFFQKKKNKNNNN
jgi:hypothetical protein